MKITPLDITQKSFRRALRGYDRQEVEAFLGLVASEVEALSKETQTLREDARRMQEEIFDLRSRERTLQETMVTAQKMCGDIRDAARKEAEITLSEAELQAEKIVQSAHLRYLRIVDDIGDAKRQRAQFEASVRALAEGHLKFLDAFRDVPAEASVEYLGAKKKAADGK
jgi:cell division initiation protein